MVVGWYLSIGTLSHTLTEKHKSSVLTIQFYMILILKLPKLKTSSTFTQTIQDVNLNLEIHLPTEGIKYEVLKSGNNL